MAPTAAPAPRHASSSPKVSGPPPWRVTMKGSSTSIGPMNRNTATTDHTSVAASQGVRQVYAAPSVKSRQTDWSGPCSSTGSARRNSPPVRSASTQATAPACATVTTAIAAEGATAPTTKPATAGPAACCSTGRLAASRPLAASSWSSCSTRGSSAE